MIKTSIAAYVALNKLLSLSTKVFLRIEEKHPDITSILTLSNNELAQLGFNEKQLHHWRNMPWELIEKELNWATQPHCHIIHWHDSTYPRALKEIASPPPVLYVQGELDAIQRQALAIVGTRHPTEYGKQNAAYFSQQLAELGFCITSGLAIGIDGIAHQHALPYPCSTVAVVATGLDQIYPQRHALLARKIMENGAIISEFPLNTPPRPEHFPRRNRIISGLSRGVLVIEAALKSGSLITARYALEQGREVFSIPGIIQNPGTHGCHALIRQGAVLVNKIDDILEELGLEIITTIKNASPNTNNPSSSFLLKHLDYGIATPMDILVARSGHTMAEITAELFSLEMSGTVSKTAEGYYRNA